LPLTVYEGYFMNSEIELKQLKKEIEELRKEVNVLKGRR
jgi:hypothetical protein